MSKIDDLIKQYCPNGVEYKELGDILDYEQPTRYIVKSARYDSNADTPVLTAGQTFILGYTFEKDDIYKASKENPVIIFDDFTTSYHWVDFNFKVKSSAMKMLRPKPDFDGIFKYVLYAMGEIHYSPQDHARQWISQYSKFKIPVPPLPVQEEIVKVLDAFTALEAELEAELEARKRQYEYYRNKLLTFDENTTEGSRIKFMQLGDVGTFIRGNGLQKKDFTDTGVGCIHYGQIYTYYGTFAERTKSYVSNELAEKLKKAQTGDLIIATTSENVEDVGKAVAWLGDENICISGDAFIYHHNQNPKYMSYLFQTNSFFEQKKKCITGVKVMRINDVAMSKFKFGFPPMEEQERIVAILDKFDSLVNNISEGLPAELTARRQQYEYYRNKLLTFDEAA